MNRENKSNILKNLALLSQIGISMVIPIVGGIYFGNFLDNKFGTGAIFLIIFCILGILASFISLFKLTNNLTKGK